MKKIQITLLTALLLTAATSHAQTWNYVNSTGTTFILYGMSFPPGQSTIGFACGMQYTYDADGVIVKTTDGGDNWVQIWPPSGAIDGLQGIWFTDNNTGFACGWNNYFIKTIDGGATWTPISVGTDVWYYRDVVFWDANNGVATASMNTAGAQSVFKTTDGGNTWVTASSGTGNDQIMGLAYADQNTVYGVSTSNHVLKSTDGGLNWTQQSTLSAMLLGVDFASSTFGVLGGEETMFATNNGGTSWTNYFTGYENFYATKAFPNGTAYIGGTDENIYYTTDYGATWSMHYNGPGTSSLYRIRFTDNGTGFACGSQGRIMKYVAPLSADFTANPTLVCTNGSVSFTDNSVGSVDSWSWTFEGGTPASSTSQNPVVTYGTPGEYDVSLTVTSGSNNSTETKTDYITVIQGLAQPNTPTGPAEVCGDYSYEYTTLSVQYAESYDWNVSPSSAGTITGDDTVATFTASNSWTGSYTIKVRAENDCGYSAWSPDFTGELYHNPFVFNLMGDGAYCEGSQGSEITLDGSETDVSYELFEDNVTTGIVVAGTGSPVSFGYFTETGLYTAEASAGNCSENMVGQIYVHMTPVPGQAGTPQGAGSVCNNESSYYTTTGASNADDYTWALDPPEAGEILANGDEATITWDNAFSGMASLSVYGMNECGDGTPSADLEIAVNALPEPAVSGLALVCNDDESEYSTADNSGSSYAWEVTGGTILSGAGTSMINVMWGDPGMGIVTVTETTADGCEGTSEAYEVTIDDCTGIGEADPGQVHLFPNPAGDRINISGLTDATLRIYDLLGKEVITLPDFDGDHMIDISRLEKGIYLVKVEERNGVSVIRLIKK